MSQSANLAFYAVLLCALGIGALVRPALALTAAVCVFGLKQWGQFTVPWLAQHAQFTNVAIGCIVLAALGMQTLRGECVPCRLRALNWIVMALFGYAFLSLLWTPRPDLAWTMVWDRGYAYVLTFVVLVPLVVKDIDGLRSALLMLAAVGGVIMVVLLVFGDWGARGLVLHGNFHQRETNPLAIAELAGSVAAAAMFVRARSWKWLGSPLRIAIVVVSLLVIVRSGSRGQLVAALCSLVVMLPVAFRLTRARGLMGIAVAITILGLAIGYAATEYMQANEARWSQSLAQHDALGRLQMASKLLGEWQRSGSGLVLGLGNSAAYDPTILGYYPHVVPLEILAEEGLVGFGLYGVILWMAFGAVRRAWRLSRNRPELSGIVAALGASFLFTFLCTLKEGNLVGSVYMFMFAIVVGRLPELLRGIKAYEARSTPTPVAGTESACAGGS
jgi:hypothetical protein